MARFAGRSWASNIQLHQFFTYIFTSYYNQIHNWRAFGSKRSEKQAKIGQMELISRATQPGLSHMGWTHGRVSHSDVPDRVNFATCIPNTRKIVIFRLSGHSKEYKYQIE
ncbi:uncharacterized protein [Gossypium hirsutum]|uniref:Uncharacterized protein n=1 Tax=Gossypium hirsutum TaxID=3635 RepID=A0ABM3ABB1_GOSHI|nr:uncharacterized protein LOC121218633 [Gossypium hirsutum]